MTQGESDLKILNRIQSLKKMWEMSLNKGNMLHSRKDLKSELWDKYI